MMETRSPPPPSGIPQSLGKTSATDVEVLLEFLFHDGKLVLEPYLLLVHIRYDLFVIISGRRWLEHVSVNCFAIVPNSAPSGNSNLSLQSMHCRKRPSGDTMIAIR